MPQAPCRILHVEDNEAEAELVRNVLDLEGRDLFERLWVRTLAEARGRLLEESFDVILLDLSLPDGFGGESYVGLKDLTEATPVVIMTSQDDSELGATLVQLGAQDYLVKSQVEGGILLRALRHAIERNRIENELREARSTALEAVRAKTQFLSGMSHEIRTPLNSILGMADLLLETPLESEQERYVKVFRSAGEVLLELINGILDLSKAEAGVLELDSQPFEPGALLEATLEVLAFSAHRKGLSLACDVAEDVPRRVSGDARRLRQVLMNLVGNAIKFTDAGEVVVSLSRVEGSGDPGHLRFAVRDTGIGIPRDKLDKIFERFSQGDPTITRRYGGTGLGLSLCVELVQLLGGRIWVESDPGRSSTFYFTVRVEAHDVGPEAPERAPAGGDRRVLIADDSETERNLLRNLLTRNGYRVQAVSNGREAVSAIEEAESRSEAYDAALIDCRMPGGGGFDVMKKLDPDSSHRNRTIVMLTADHRTGDIRECDRLGVGGWLVKPWKNDLLLDQVAEVTGDARPAAPRAHQEPLGAGVEARGTARPLSILLVDDCEDNRALVCAYLKGTSHRIEEAENGLRAVEQFKTGNFDLVLMDMQMPVMDGYRSTRSIRSWETSRGRGPVPILALTAYAFPEERSKSLEAGCDAHLDKPIRKQTLLDAVAHYAGGGEPQPILVEVEEDVRELVDGFLENRHADVARLERALEAGDFETIRIAGHNMKGVGRNYGFEGITEIGAALEQAGVRLLAAEVRKKIHELQDYLERVTIADTAG